MCYEKGHRTVKKLVDNGKWKKKKTERFVDIKRSHAVIFLFFFICFVLLRRRAQHAIVVDQVVECHSQPMHMCVCLYVYGFNTNLSRYASNNTTSRNLSNENNWKHTTSELVYVACQCNDREKGVSKREAHRKPPEMYTKRLAWEILTKLTDTYWIIAPNLLVSFHN